jgi:pimeloyl-ACP methyl ester carboxylesterase
MARIVMVHGAGNSLWGPASIRSRWYPALSDGLAWHGVEVAESDVEVAFYGDLFRKDPERGYDPNFDIKEMLTGVSGILRAHDQEIDLDELVKVLVDRHLDRLLAQAGADLEDDRIRQLARARLEAVIGPETEVVVAHSLGTVVAYETLCRHPEWSVTGLVTMGSPLRGEMILNIRNADDPACIRPLSEVFDGPVSERLVDNGHRVHDPEPYLNNATTGGAVADMLSA